MKTKKAPLVSAAIFFTVFILAIYTIASSKDERSILKGTYQTEILPQEDGVISLVFDDGKFLQEMNSNLVDYGIYEEVEENVYILKSELKDDYFVLLNKEFYYYVKELREPMVLKFKQVSTVPSYSIKQEDNPMF